MKFREHRGGLADSMATMVELPNRAALIDHLCALARSWPTFPLITSETVHIEFFGWDNRIDWEKTYIVTLDGYGVLGFTNSSFRNSPERLEKSDMTLDDIVIELRKLYPKALSVRLYVTAASHEVQVSVCTRRGPTPEYDLTLDGTKIENQLRVSPLVGE